MKQIQAEIGIEYRFWVPGEPVPKSTQRPPKCQGAYHIVMSYPKYSRLAKTWKYQATVAEYAMAGHCPIFSKDDPLRLSLEILKTKHKTGDTKNILAAIEDGLQYGKFIPNDRQVTSLGEVNMSFNAGKACAGVMVMIQIDPRVTDLEWLISWLGTKAKAVTYQEKHDIVV